MSRGTYLHDPDHYKPGNQLSTNKALHPLGQLTSDQFDFVLLEVDMSAHDKEAHLNYPFCLDSYCDGLDDGVFCQRELQEKSKSWRSETYAPVSNVLILEHDRGVGSSKFCDDTNISEMLAQEHQPQCRIILLQPTPHERLVDSIRDDPDLLKSLLANELIKNDDAGSSDGKSSGSGDKYVNEVKSELNITRSSLLKILSRYDIAPAAASHIRGQEQIFGSRCQMEDDSATVKAFEFWYAIRARLYVQKLGKEADLKMTIVTRHCLRTRTTVYLLKYRSFNDLPGLLHDELVQNLEAFVRSSHAQELVQNPFVLSTLHFGPTIQYYRRAAREPRDSIRDVEQRVHGGSEEVERVDLRKLHLTLGSLDQDRIQMSFILEVIGRLRRHHDQSQSIIRARYGGRPGKNWVGCRVEEELDRFENQMQYFRSSNEDVARRVERLVELLFNMSARISSQSTMQMTRYAMQESASVGTISIVTMVFLPGTFIAGILGTNIIAGPSRPDHAVLEPDDLRLLVSSQWWILVVATVALTLATFAVGWLLRRRGRRMIEKKIRRIGQGEAV